MLNIYYAGESCDKTRFIFDSTDPDRETILIVPDQASLQMERDALDYFREKDGRTALFDFMVTDFSSLGYKVVKEAGGRQPELIDKYGRQMLLSILIDRLAESGELGVYKNMRSRSSFVSNANQLISEMKRYGISSEDIGMAAGETGSYLSLKLADINSIYKAYEEAIDDRFTDSEDYIRFYGQLMEDSEMIRDSVVWITGFDTFTPLNMEIIQRLLKAAPEVNVVMTWDEEKADGEICDARFLTTGGGEGLFDLTEHVMDSLIQTAEGAGVPWKKSPIKGVHRESIWDDDPIPKITLMETSNIYAEADRAAAYVTELVRDEKLRYRDIAVICNDMDVRGSVLRRTFERWGIPAFADRKRKVLHQPVVRFLLSFLQVIAEGYTDAAVMEMISAGLMGFSRRDEELLNNYVSEAKIRGSKWKQPFTWEGKNAYGGRYTGSMKRLNEMREVIVDVIEEGRDEIGKRNTAEEKIRGLTRFLEDRFEITGRIGELIQRQEDLGLAEGAAETAQSWTMICGVFEQVINVVGEEKISNRQLCDILTEGLKEMEIGLVPATTDCVIIGTLQRTRISRCPVLIVTAANEGVLPMSAGGGGLLTERELDTLEELKYSIAKKDEVRRQEEQLAIYRMFSLPSKELVVMCSRADQDGRSISPSAVFSVLWDMKDIRKLGDLGDEDVTDRIASRKGSLSFMADAMQNYMENGQIDDAWLAAMKWYEENDPDSISRIRQGLDFDNKVQDLEEAFADSLYFGDKDSIYVSASRLETYSSCPFRYFIEKGLRVDEPDGFETSGKSRGDVFHMAMQQLSAGLTEEAKAAELTVTDPASPWMTITEEECRKRIDKIIRDETADYREGVYVSDNEAKLQLEQIIDQCSEIAWAMINQVRRSKVKDMFFEEPFGEDSERLPTIKIELERGKSAVLTGIIDRLDVIEVPEDDKGKGDGGSREAVRVVDYKTGKETIDIDKIREGYKLQLMLYMNVAENAEVGGEDTAVIPAGVFYFKIQDIDEKTEDMNGPSASVEDRVAKSCKLQGIMVGEEQVLMAMDDTVMATRYAKVLPLQKVKTGVEPLGSSQLLTEKEFRKLCDTTIENVKQICAGIQSGHIGIEPKREKDKKGDYAMTSCTYCSFKSICLFDTSFRNCRYKLI